MEFLKRLFKVDYYCTSNLKSTVDPLSLLFIPIIRIRFLYSGMAINLTSKLLAVFLVVFVRAPVPGMRSIRLVQEHRQHGLKHAQQVEAKT